MIVRRDAVCGLVSEGRGHGGMVTSILVEQVERLWFTHKRDILWCVKSGVVGAGGMWSVCSVAGLGFGPKRWGLWLFWCDVSGVLGEEGGRLKRCICGIGCNNTEKLWMLGSSILGIGGRGEERKLIKYAVGGPCDDWGCDNQFQGGGAKLKIGHTSFISQHVSYYIGHHVVTMWWHREVSLRSIQSSKIGVAV